MMGTDYPLTTPSMLCRYLCIRPGDMLKSAFHATGTVFYVIEGSGHSKGAGTSFDWSAGDAFVFPGGISTHHQAGPGGAVLYCADDEPTLRFYRLRPDSSAVTPSLYSKARPEEHTSELPSLMRNQYAVFC